MLLIKAMILTENLPSVLPLHNVDVFVINYTGHVNLLVNWLPITLTMFLVGVAGIVYNFRNFLVTIMAAEVMYLGVVTSFVFYSIAALDVNAAVYALLILIFTACESAVGLGLLIVLYRFGFGLTFNAYTTLHS